MFTRFRASKAVILALALILAMVSAVSTAAADPATGYENGALTPPPPVTGNEQKLIRLPAQRTDSGTQPYSFDPSHIYLEDGNNLLTNLHNGTVDMSGATFATVSAETIGVQLTLQRWTGSAWVNHDVSGYYVDNYSTYHAGSKIVTITKGYYYRIVSYHYVNHSGVYESGNVTGISALIN